MSIDRYDDLDLPLNPTIEGLTVLLGEEKLAQLSIDFGGSMVSIPTKVGENSPIAFSIGMDAAQKLVDVWGGMQFTVPLAVGKKETIRRALKEGKLSINKLCRIHRVSRSEVYRVIAEDERKNQLNLF